MNWNIGIDIGNRNTRLTIKGRGLVYRQSSAVALRAGAPIAQGNEAYDMLGRAGTRIDIAFPMQAHTIAREDALKHWLTYLIRQATQSGLVHRPRVLIARPPRMEEAQMRRLVAMAMEAGASSCSLIRSDLAAMIGAEMPLMDAPACALVDAGAGGVTATLVARGRVLASESLPFGMASLDDAIVRLLRAQYGLAIGPRTAEDVKIALAAAVDKPMVVPEKVTGLLGATGLPGTVEIAPAQIVEALKPLLQELRRTVECVVGRASGELAADLLEQGVMLAGGGAALFALDRSIAEATGLACRVADDPACAVVRGLEDVLDDSDAYESLTEAHQSLLDRRAPGI